MNTTVKFIDADGYAATIEAEVKETSKGLTFSASGEHCGSAGQCLDSINPRTEAQRQLIDLWKKYHLNDVPENFVETLENLIETIEEEEEERKGEPLTDLNDAQLLAIIEENTTFEGRDAELCAALVKMFDLCLNDLADIEINDTRATVQGVDYLAGTDEEMNEAWEEELENYIDECILPDLANESLNRYFDREAWKNDARHDGRGHALNRWNGGEEEASINNTYYYAYRQ